MTDGALDGGRARLQGYTGDQWDAVIGLTAKPRNRARAFDPAMLDTAGDGMGATAGEWS